MQPKKHRTTSLRTAKARAKMYLTRDLNWLTGFPVGQSAGAVDWIFIPHFTTGPPEVISLEQSHLHRASRTWSELAHRFPRVMPMLFNDFQQWREQVPWLFEQLKAGIHRNEALPSSLLAAPTLSPGVRRRALTLAQEYPSLSPLVDALSWVLFLFPGEMLTALRWLEANVGELITLLEANPDLDGLKAAFILWNLVQLEGERRVAPLVGSLGHRAVFSVPVQGAAEFTQKLASACRKASTGKNIKALPTPPEPDSGPLLLAFGAWLLTQNRSTRRRALTLFELLLSKEVWIWWQQWWASISDCYRQARQKPSLAQFHLDQSTFLNISKLLERLVKQPPPRPHLGLLLTLVRELADIEQRNLYRLILPPLRRLPQVENGRLVRAAFLHHWAKLTQMHPQKFRHYLPAFNGFQQKIDYAADTFAPWRTIPDRWQKSKPAGFEEPFEDALWLNGVPGPEFWSNLFEATIRCGFQLGRPLTTADCWQIITLLENCEDMEETVACFLALPTTDDEHWYSAAVLRCAIALAGGQPNFGLLVARLEQLEEHSWPLIEAVQLTHSALSEAGWTNMASALLLDGQAKAIQTIAAQVSILNALKRAVAPPPFPAFVSSPLWLDRYPADVQPTLKILNAVSPQAEQLANRLLGKQFPLPESLEQEIGAIEALLTQRPGDSRLAGRLANLRRRLAQPVSVSPGRTARLIERLNQTIRRAVLQVWQDEMTTQRYEAGMELLGVPVVPDWLIQPKYAAAIGYLLRLPTIYKQLALQLLRRRCGEPPWSFWDEPANHSFIEKLHTLGVRPDPWVWPDKPELWTGQNGRQVWLGIETDPLEIFLMGGYFNTCLSPSDFNYFSTVANAIDINKQVVYARDERGVVVGRCLLALTDAGGILVFHPYCHDPGLGFDEVMVEFAGRLAAQMQTMLVSKGRVSSLVAPDWYDDGPQTVDVSFDCLQPGSALRQSLLSIAPDALKPTLRQAFAPQPLNGLTLPLIIDLPEFETRPELILPLLPQLEQSRGLFFRAWLRAAQLAHKAGAPGYARRVLKKQFLTKAKFYFEEEYSLVDDLGSALELWLQLDPSAVLRLLRQTRPTGIRRDKDEISKRRRHWLARAHAALGRYHRAKTLQQPTGDQ